MNFDIVKRTVSFAIALILASSTFSAGAVAEREKTPAVVYAASAKINAKKTATEVARPSITKLENTLTGTKISWSKCKGAAKYRIYYIEGKGSWNYLATVDGTTYTHKKLKNGKTYTYKVRCLDSNGKFLGDAGAEKKNVFIAPVKLSGVSNDGAGVLLKWKAVRGVSRYKVYRRTKNSSWKEIAVTKKTAYTDKKVKSDIRYFYSIACLDNNKKALSVRGSASGIRHIKAPTITKFQNTETDTIITWSKSKGAAKYRIYYIEGKGNWNYLATVNGTTYTHKNLKSGRTYTYKVRCLDGKNNAISGTKDGKTNIFVAPLQVSGVSKAKNGTRVKWNSVKGVSGYRVYRKVFGGEWKKLGDVSGASYIDTTAKKDKVYSYSVRCLNKNGRLISAYTFNGVYYKNSKTANGIIGSKSAGWFYAGKNGKINYNYVNGIEQDGIKWIVTNGRAKKASTRSDIVLFRAAQEAAKATNTSMTKEEKLWACFRYCQTAYNEKRPRTPHYTGMDWPIIYAEDMFVRDGGNCCSYAAAFAYLAKAIGYTEVYCCNSGGHGWAEIDGRIYDPEWGRHYTNYTYFGLDYDEISNPNYKGAIAAKKPWMYIKI